MYNDWIRITVNGQEYDSIESAIDDIVTRSMLRICQEKIAPFENEIKLEGGIVDINLENNKNPSMKISGISDDLKARIEASWK
jgi:hypothetical protein